MVGKKRLLLVAASLASIGAVVALATGVTFGLFSATAGSNVNKFTTGTVTLTPGTDYTTGCTVSDYKPNTPAGTCTFSVSTGATDNPQDVAVDVATSSTPGTWVQGYNCTPGGTNSAGLYDGTGDGLQATLSSDNPDAVASYDLTGLGSNGSIADLLTHSAVAAGTTITYTLHYSFPTQGCADNSYQGSGTTFTFEVHSVQSVNNPDLGTPGQPDPATATHVWS